MAGKYTKSASVSSAMKQLHLSDETLQPPVDNSELEDNHFSQLVHEWFIKNKTDIKMTHPEIVELAAAGLEKEGKLAGREDEGKKMGKMLREVKYGNKKEIILLCVRIYTMDSFLFKTLGKTMREFDMSKVDTLGPYCYFFNCYPEALGRNYYIGTTYRGIKLDEKTIETYKQAVGQWKSWPAFTTTQKRREVAKAFGNVLFIIELTASTRYGKAIDISHMSEYPQEEEILMLPGSNFRITKMEYDGHNQPIFYLTVV